MKKLARLFTASAVVLALATIDAAPAIAASYIEVRAGGSGATVQSHSAGLTYNSVSGLFFSSTGPLNGTTETYSPTSLPTGLTTAAVSAGVAGTNGSGSGYAYGDLTTATVGAYAFSSGNQGSGSAESLLNDDVTFDVAGGGTKQIGVNAHLDGLFTLSPTDPFTLAGFSYRLVLGGANFIYTNQTDPRGSNTNIFGIFGASAPVGWDSYSFTNVTDHGFDFTGLLTIADGETGHFIQDLQVGCQAGANCDFSHTGAFSLDLPEGVTFTSGSGVLLSPPVSGVPELGTWMMLLVGLGAIGAALRRRNGMRGLGVAAATFHPHPGY